MATFVDRVTLHLSAGHGGNGCVSVRREKFKPLAGPDGGNGGDGGDIVLVADPQVTTLLGYHRSPHRSSKNGQPGMGDHRSGVSGEVLELPMPVGTVVYDESGEVIADLTEPGMRVVVAPGGQGGLGNAALSTTKRKAPGFALLGTEGWTVDISLELKTIAESGDTRFTVADVPGLIEGASEGKGLGLEFLRHVERCEALLHVIDCATLDPGRDPISDLDVILGELERYPVPEGQVPLLERPQLVALNKIDVPEAQELAEFVTAELEGRGYRVFPISTASRKGLRELTFALADIVEQARAARAAEPVPERIVLRPRSVNEKPFTVRAEGGEEHRFYRVRGAKPERWVQQTDFTNEEAIGYLADRLAKLGVEDGLFKAGAVAGSTVVIGGDGGMVFDWEPTLTSTAELITSARGTDARIGATSRPTRNERREEYFERMDAKAAARAELEQERVSGLWVDDDVVTSDQLGTSEQVETSDQKD
jgi:GTP-binding protein